LKLQLIFFNRFNTLDLSKIERRALPYITGKFTYFYFFKKLPHQFLHHCTQLSPLYKDRSPYDSFISQWLDSFINQWWESHQDAFKNRLQQEKLIELKMEEKLEIGKTLACLSSAGIKDQTKKEYLKTICQSFWKEEKFKIQLEMLKLKNCDPDLILKKIHENEFMNQDRSKLNWINLGKDWIDKKTQSIENQLSLP